MANVGHLTTLIPEEANHTVEVKCYSGFKVNERPLSFTHSGREFSVMDIEGGWFEEDECGSVRKACFRVRADDGDLPAQLRRGRRGMGITQDMEAERSKLDASRFISPEPAL